MKEARFLAYQALDSCLPRGVPQGKVKAILDAARPRRAGLGQAARAGDGFERALADMVLGGIVRGVAADIVADALQEPFAGILPLR